ncbi:MAG: hypothetical protein R3B89_35400 [Polyangiaceae bacterium]
MSAIATLVFELLANPARFIEQGRSYALLQEYFGGEPIDSLRPLLAHEDANVQRAATFVASELGVAAAPLVRDVAPLLLSSDPHVLYQTMDVLMVCAIGRDASEFVHLVRMMTSSHAFLRRRAMFLVGNAARDQLVAAMGRLESHVADDRVHLEGLTALGRAEQLSATELLEWIRGDCPLLRRYGVLAVEKAHERSPSLLLAAQECDDPDVREFAKRLV